MAADLRLYREAFRNGTRLLRDAAGNWLVPWTALLLLPAAFPPIFVVLTRRVVDGMTEAIAGADLMPVYVAGGLFAVVYLVQRVTNAYGGQVQLRVDLLATEHVQGVIQERALASSMGQFESPRFHDMLTRARTEGLRAPLSVVSGILGSGRTILAMAAMIAVLLPLGYLPFLAFIVAVIPTVLLARRHSKRNHEWRLERTPMERRSRYRDELMTQLPPAPEVRTLRLGPRLREEYRVIREDLRDQRLSLEGRHIIERTLAQIWAFGIMGLLMFWLVQQAVGGLMTLGALAMYYAAYQQTQGMATSLSQNAGRLLTTALNMQVLQDFLEEPIASEESGGEDPAPYMDGDIEFQKVWFRYPETDRDVLRGIDLRLGRGKTVAIVGPNGAGKSTMVKLMLGLHAPTQGHITIGGQDVVALDADLWRRHLAVVFQRPTRFETDLRGNILVDDALQHLDADRLTAALKAAGADDVAASLPQGLETPVGRRFGGLELSGGQWQRIALARAMVRDAPILVMDEPTTGMDPWAEEQWIKRFHEMAKGRTTLIISHRMKAARMADAIHVVEDGCIVESGDHDELLAADGRYAQAWRFDGWGSEEPAANGRSRQDDADAPVMRPPRLAARQRPDGGVGR